MKEAKEAPTAAPSPAATSTPAKEKPKTPPLVEVERAYTTKVTRPMGERGQGRKPRFARPRDLEDVAFKYFSDCVATRSSIRMTGLALAAGISIQTLDTYRHKKEFKGVFEWIRTVVEDYNVHMTYSQFHHVGPIFILKAKFGYKDDGPIDVNLKLFEHFLGQQNKYKKVR